jgi:nickel/cobalt transporter (NicO) family protein
MKSLSIIVIAMFGILALNVAIPQQTKANIINKQNNVETQEKTKKTVYRNFIIWQRKGLVLINKNLRVLKKQFNLSVYLGLVLLSIIYGSFHALGPGHGKALVSSYFVHRKAKKQDAFKLALIVAFIHSGAALLLALLYFSILSQVKGMARMQVQNYFNVFTSILIITIAVFFLWQKIKGKGHHVDMPDSASQKSLWVVGLASGVIPCPVSVTIMLLAIPSGLFFVGLTTVLGMSLGLFIVLLGVGLVTIKSRDKIIETGSHKEEHNHSRLHGVLSYSGIVIFLFVGIFILYNSLSLIL